MSRGSSRRGLAGGDVLLALAVLALVAAVALPPIRRAALERRTEEAVALVQAVASAAEHFRNVEDRWPDSTGVGEVPTEVAQYLPPDFSFQRGGYRLDLVVWERAEPAPPMELPQIATNRPPGLLPDSSTGLSGPLPDPTEAPPGLLPDTTVAVPKALFGSLAAVTVQADQPRLLAGLLDHFGGQRSFVHGDTWTLIFASVPGR